MFSLNEQTSPGGLEYDEDDEQSSYQCERAQLNLRHVNCILIEARVDTRARCNGQRHELIQLLTGLETDLPPNRATTSCYSR